VSIPPIAAYIERLERIHALSEALRAAAADGQWERAVDIEATRRPLIEALFPVPPEVSRERLAAALARLLESDRELIALGERAQGEIADGLTGLARGRQAVNAYTARDAR
jgi:hypothetical protein